MKKLAAQQVQQEKDEGQKRLEEVLKKARDEFLLEKAEAIQKTREEERAMAIDEAKKVAQVEEDKRKQLILAAEKEKQVELLSLVYLKGIKIMWLSFSDKEFSIPPGLDATTGKNNLQLWSFEGYPPPSLLSPTSFFPQHFSKFPSKPGTPDGESKDFLVQFSSPSFKYCFASPPPPLCKMC